MGLCVLHYYSICNSCGLRTCTTWTRRACAVRLPWEATDLAGKCCTCFPTAATTHPQRSIERYKQDFSMRSRRPWGGGAHFHRAFWFHSSLICPSSFSSFPSASFSYIHIRCGSGWPTSSMNGCILVWILFFFLSVAVIAKALCMCGLYIATYCRSMVGEIQLMYLFTSMAYRDFNISGVIYLG